MTPKLSATSNPKEVPSRIEPASIEGEILERIADRAGEVLAAGSAFGAILHPKTAASGYRPDICAD